MSEEAFVVSFDTGDWDYYMATLYASKEIAEEQGPRELAQRTRADLTGTSKMRPYFFVGRITIRRSWDVVERKFVGTWTVEDITKHPMPTGDL